MICIMNIEKDSTCDDLFDPCTGEPTDLKGLEQRILELRQRDLPERLNFPKEIKTRLDLLIYLLQRPNPPDDSLLQYTNNGQLYESYWDIVFSLGLMKEFPITKDFYMYNGKIEELENLEVNNDKFSNSPLEYLTNKINEGPKRGAADFTFLYNEHVKQRDDDACSSDVTPTPCEKYKAPSTDNSGPLFYFCSSKYFKKDDNKGVDKYDIQNIFTAAKKLQNYKSKIILLVRDKQAVEDKLKNALRRYIAEEGYRVYGIEELWVALGRLYHYVREKTNDLSRASIIHALGLKEKMKPILDLRLHQHLAVMKICNAILEKKNSNRYLVGIVPRGGKTYIAGGIIHTLKPRRVVVLLGATSETFSQFEKDLFNTFQNFSEYKIVSVKDEHDTKPVTYLEKDKKYIFIMSVELFKGDGTRSLLRELKSGESGKVDLFICDEAHLKQVTKKNETAMKQSTLVKMKKTQVVEQEMDSEIDDAMEQELLSFGNIPIVYMTGTYRKPLTAFRIPEENVILWNYSDIQKAKELITNEPYFQEAFGPYYDRALNACGQTREVIQEQYRLFPDLHFITTVFTEESKNEFLKDSKSGFPTLSHLFELNTVHDWKSHDRWHAGFQNKGVKRLIDYLSQDAMKHIDHIGQRIGDRLRFVTSTFVTHTQLWFLPILPGGTDKRMRALAGAIFQNKWFRSHFDILGVSSLEKKNESVRIQIEEQCGTVSWVDSSTENMKQYIVDHESKVRRNGRGLILLALNTLQVGISLPCVDVVVLLDDGKSLDARIQKIYRALTESTDKKAGYIIDMNYFRTVKAQMSYEIITNTYRKGKTYSSDRKELLNRVLNVYSVDSHLPILRPELEKGLLPELEKIDTSEIFLKDAGNILNQDIQNVVGSNYQENYDAIFGILPKESQHQTHTIRDMGTNVIQAKHNDNRDETSNNQTPQNEKPRDNQPNDLSNETKRDSYLDAVRVAIKIGAFGTDAGDLATLEKRLSHDNELRNMVYDTLVSRGTLHTVAEREGQQSYVIDHIIRPSISKLIEQGKNISYKDMKNVVNREDRYPKEISHVLNYIHAHLSPKEREVQKFGEVFTPMTLVDEMLDLLPPEVWTNKNLTWLDPANGMGNYPIAVFLRLCYGTDCDGNQKTDGLTKLIPNEKVRKKHIIEKMLYMVEINMKNIAISRRLIEKLAPGTVPNIKQIDKNEGYLSDKTGFPIKQFDIVMGNPPYNGGRVRAKTTIKTKKRKEAQDTEEPGKNLWIEFVKKVLDETLKENGYLLFIHPIGWFRPERTGIHDKMLSKQIHIIKQYNRYVSKKMFSGNGKINIAYYLLQNKPIDSSTTMFDMLSHTEILHLNSKSILCSAYNSIYEKVIKKCKLFGKDIYSSSQSNNEKNPCIAGKFPQLKTFGEDGNIIFIKTNKEHEYQNKSKLFLFGYNTPRVYYDKKGEYGAIGTHHHYFIGDKLDKLYDYFNTHLSALLLEFVKYDQDYLEPKFYPDIRSIDGMNTITDKSLADYFGFTEEERSNIMKHPIYNKKYQLKEESCMSKKINSPTQKKLPKHEGTKKNVAKRHNDLLRNKSKKNRKNLQMAPLGTIIPEL